MSSAFKQRESEDLSRIADAWLSEMTFVVLWFEVQGVGSWVEGAGREV